MLSENDHGGFDDKIGMVLVDSRQDLQVIVDSGCEGEWPIRDLPLCPVLLQLYIQAVQVLRVEQGAAVVQQRARQCACAGRIIWRVDGGQDSGEIHLSTQGACLLPLE